MNFELATGPFLAFMFALVRASAWLAFTPPFSSRVIPLVVRTGLAAALALAATPQLSSQSGALQTMGTGAFIAGLVVQAAIGALLGYITSLMFGVLMAGGALTDMSSGLSAATIYDPISGTPNPVTANTYNVIMTTLVFVTGGDLLIVKGFLTSFKAFGLSTHSAALIGPTLVSEIGFFFVAAVEIAAPVFACMFLTYIAMGLITRSAPQLNIMSIGFGVNIAIALTVVGICLPLLPGAVSTLVDRAVTDGLGLLGARP
ncbi:MAG TPA: flagellar biosynthetic protein FliR [Acidimicrobiales bacterium]|nr:flagellar biosynthetic protein FliR [Acidimicrobiales bacterium]